TAGGASTTLLQFELLTLRQCTFHPLAHLPHAGAQFAGGALLAHLRLAEFVGHVQAGHDEPALHAHAAGALAGLLQPLLEQGGGAHQVVALVGRAGDQVFLVEDADADGFGRRAAHMPFSSMRRREIMASTPARACSFFCSRAARSLARCSWRWRRARFSSVSCCTSESSSLMRTSRRCRSASMAAWPCSWLICAQYCLQHRSPGKSSRAGDGARGIIGSTWPHPPKPSTTCSARWCRPAR